MASSCGTSVSTLFQDVLPVVVPDLVDDDVRAVILSEPTDITLTMAADRDDNAIGDVAD